MSHSPMISVPMKATNEVDWIAPLKSYIKESYGDDPERYAEECATLNRLRQDMRGAGKESTSGRDMLYRYYGQLELLDLRFPVDEQHIKIAFTWFDAFTQKPTTQYSLAFEKASVIFNISAVLSCYAVYQNRGEEALLKVAYHSLQASAGMYTYINENFLHAPSFDLSRETVKSLISIMLAQAQEVFLEKQVADQKKPGLLAKLASQAGYLYGQSIEGVQDNVNRAIFEKVWLIMVQIKANLLDSIAQYYQSLVDNESKQHGIAIGRLQVAETLAKEAERQARSFPSSVPVNSNLSADCGSILHDMSKRHLSTVQDKLRETVRENDYIYHHVVPAEASLAPIAKMSASKAIPVTELYAGLDMQRITGPDLFVKIVPLAVTESASLYDEEKAKLIRAETEKVDAANGEMAASLDYLRLPGALQILKGGFEPDVMPDEDFRQWCCDVADHDNPAEIFARLREEKESIVAMLDNISKQLDLEEITCEKMRATYEGEWNQQPSARSTTTLRSDVRKYREALDEAAKSDGQLATSLRQHENIIDEMRQAAQEGTVDQLFQNAVTRAHVRGSHAISSLEAEPNLLDTDFGESAPSVKDQINKVEEILKKLNLIKRERNQVLKDLKEKVHNDDISQVLILNKKSIANYENQLFEQELEKFIPHQNRLLQAIHKQSQLMKELTVKFNDLLQDKQVRSEQSKYEAVQRQRSSVMLKYKRAYQEFLDMESGLQGAKIWYSDTRETVESLQKNVETFVLNRRAEGAQLLQQIQENRAASKSSQAELEQERLRELMGRMTVESPALPTPQTPTTGRPTSAATPAAIPAVGQSPRYPQTMFQGQQYQVPTSPPAHQAQYPGYSSPPPPSTFSPPTYNPSQYGPTTGPTSPPASQTSFAGGYMPQSPPPNQASFGQQPHQNKPHPMYGNYVGAQAQPHLQQPHQQSQPQQNQYQHQQPQAQPHPQVHQQQAPPQPQSGYVPPGFVPPPPPPGPPPLGPQQTFHYQDYNGKGEQTHEQRPLSSQTQSANDPWAGLHLWK
ncbi:bck1-like resistance to osmotic shock [Claviceps sp. Clav32 group G5]|nr:bck1-like resistance to osmotic shock [Claviceps sp. Clav32 group G5]KAG6049409.1 bck1-like resistance to osmotic shock [Claviceps sp. Clav50 group G5]